MPPISRHTKHATLDCGVHLTLPGDFVREWNASVGQQQWIAEISRHDHDDEQLEEGNMRATCSMGSAAVACREIDVPVPLETNMSVVADSEGREKTYLSVKFTGVQLHVHDGTLQITVLDVKSKGMDDVGKAEPDAPMVPEDTDQEQAAPENFSVERQTAETTDSLKDKNSTLTGNGSRARRAGAKRKRAPASKGHDPGVSRRPVVGSDPASVQLGDSSDKPAPTPLHSYRLRDKKLSFTKFGACEVDLEDADTGDHPPQFRPQTVKKLRRAKLCVENDSDPAMAKDASKVSRQSLNEHRQHSCSSKTDADTETETDQSPIKTVASALSDSVSSLRMKGKEEKPSSSLSKLMITGSEQPSKRTTANSDQPSSQRTRMKIDIRGLPSFPRRVASKGRKASCRYCGKRLSDYTGVVVHARKWHGGEKDLQQYLGYLKTRSATRCALCDARFETRLQLQRHEDNIHFKTGAMRCEQCGKVFPNTSLLKQHVRTVHLTQGQAHRCTLCTARFKWAATLKTHLAEVHHSDGAGRLTCQECGKAFQRRSQLNRHSLIHAPPSARLTCRLCGRGFRHGSNLRRHVSAVHEARREAWHCAYCGAGFGRGQGWTDHVEKVHLALFPHRCSACQAGFIRRALLDEHVAARHGGEGGGGGGLRAARGKYGRREEEKAACVVCGDRFCYKAQLVRHVFSAHGHLFPFRCHLCPQVFMERPFLLLHRQRAHQLQPGLEDAALEGEETLERTSGLQPERTVVPQVDRKMTTTSESSSVETGGVVVWSEDAQPLSAAIGEGGQGVQYVLQIPGELSAAPPHALLHYIAGWVSTDLPLSQATVDTSVGHQPPPCSSSLLGHSAATVTERPQGNTVPRTHSSQAFGERLQRVLAPRPVTSTVIITEEPEGSIVLVPHTHGSQAHGEGLHRVLAATSRTSTGTGPPQSNAFPHGHGSEADINGEGLQVTVASTVLVTKETGGNTVPHGDWSEAYGEGREQALAPSPSPPVMSGRVERVPSSGAQPQPAAPSLEWDGVSHMVDPPSLLTVPECHGIHDNTPYSIAADDLSSHVGGNTNNTSHVSSSAGTNCCWPSTNHGQRPSFAGTDAENSALGSSVDPGVCVALESVPFSAELQPVKVPAAQVVDPQALQSLPSDRVVESSSSACGSASLGQQVLITAPSADHDGGFAVFTEVQGE